MVKSRLALNPDGSVRNWDYKPEVVSHLIARLNLSLGVSDTEASKEYI